MVMETDTLDDLNHFDPLAFAARTSDPDTPAWNDAIHSPKSNAFWDAMYSETLGLLKVNAWSQVQRTTDMTAIPVTWAFRIKCVPSGLIRKYKARLCVRGDLQRDDT